MSSRAPRISSTASSEASTLRASATRSSGAGLGRAFGQRTRVEPRRVERLEDVVARRGEEARLGEIGFLGLGLGARQRLIETLELGGALLHAPLQPLVGRGEFLLGEHGLRHVGVGRDDAAVGQPRRADLDHALGGIEAQAHRLVVVEQALDALGDEIVGRPRPIGAARGVEAHDLVEPDAEPQHRAAAGRTDRRIRGSRRSSARLLSNTVMPWRAWSSACCN